MEIVIAIVLAFIAYVYIVEATKKAKRKAKKFNKLVAKSEYLLYELDLDDKPEMQEYDNEFDASLYGQFLERYK